jgi:hypothetical protein
MHLGQLTNRVGIVLRFDSGRFAFALTTDSRLFRLTLAMFMPVIVSMIVIMVVAVIRLCRGATGRRGCLRATARCETQRVSEQQDQSRLPRRYPISSHRNNSSTGKKGENADT